MRRVERGFRGTGAGRERVPSGIMAKIVRVELKVGMEVHVELSTRTKMFSAAPSPAWSGFEGAAGAGMGGVGGFGPNEAIDEVVLGLPGALPVINREAVERSMRVGMMLGCSVARWTKWDRKGYFYPDLPKGYQISQYDLPLCFDGAVDVPEADEAGLVDWTGEKGGFARIGIIRAHLEEDAGKLLHEMPGGGGGGVIEGSIVDLNRAGTALLEVVTAPDFTSAGRCVGFAQMLRQMCRYCGASEGVLQKGHMRFEPNVNCMLTLEDGRVVKTPIVEVKNLNSFRALRGAIEYELREQPGRWERDGREMSPGNKVTRGWDETAMNGAGATFVQREKEEAADYRYFPDPDLLGVKIDQAWQTRVRETIPEAMGPRIVRYVSQWGLSVKEADALTGERADSDLYEKAIDIAAEKGAPRHGAARGIANLLLQNGAKRANERTARRIEREGQLARPVIVSELGVAAAELAQIYALREAGKISAAGADELFGALCVNEEEQNAALAAGGAAMKAARDVEAMAQQRGLIIERDESAMAVWVAQAIAENAKAAEDVRAGKDQAVGRIVGSAMKLAAGKGDAAALREAIIRALRG